MGVVREISDMVNTPWGKGFLFVCLFAIVMFAYSSAEACDARIEKLAKYCNIEQQGEVNKTSFVWYHESGTG